MKKLILLVSLILSLPGCVTNRVDLIKASTIELKEVVPPELNIRSSVFEDDGNLVVLGRLSRGSLDKRRIPGHVDIKVLAADGGELANIKAQFRSLQTWRHGPNPVTFKVEMPGAPPTGSTVQIKYHVSDHE